MRFFVHEFDSLNNIGFSPVEYSKLKFGSDIVAKKFGYELATAFFEKHSAKLLANKCVVIPSPYNFVKNAATVLTHHFCNKLNELLVSSNGEHVDYTLIHRKVSYTNDYGFLSKEKRKSLIDNDAFYLNKKFIKGKLLIFVDDIRITGTHEDKLRDIMLYDNIKNEAFFLYYGNYKGNSPDVEAKLNFSAITCPKDYFELMSEKNRHVIVRPIKYVLSQPDLPLEHIDDDTLSEIYHGCLGEGYFRIPQYQSNFTEISDEMARRRLK